MFSQIISYSWSHANSKSSFRDVLALSNQDRNNLYQSIDKQSEIIEFVMLSTCNRIEFYIVAKNNFNFLDWLYEVYIKNYDRYLDLDSHPPAMLTKEDAILHLFRVASGIESLIIGEKQILNQVHNAYNDIFVKNTFSNLKKCFLEAVKCGEFVQSQTKSDNTKTSISKEVVKQISKIDNTFNIKKILIVGSGQAAKLTAESFMDQGARNIFITNHTESKGIDLANNLKVHFISYKNMINILHAIDIVVTATNSMKYLFYRKDIINSFSKIKTPKIIFVDISSPRNIEPSIKNIKGVTLIDIDELKNNRLEISTKHSESIYFAQKIVSKYFKTFYLDNCKINYNEVSTNFVQ